MGYIVHLDDDFAVDPELAGHKFASLAQAHRAGFPVLKAFVVCVEAHLQYLRNGKWPPGLTEELRESIASLELDKGISVRSSGTTEDLENRSFAGQYKTFLNVRSEADLLEKIAECWASAGNIDKAYIRSSFKEEHPEKTLSMAVILQQMVQSKWSGVAFSRHPLHPERDETIIECVEGLGENLVGGLKTPQRAYVDSSGNVRMDDLENMPGSNPPFLNDDQWRQVAKLAAELEKHSSGAPRDIEWAISNEGKLWLLQSRPITTPAAADRIAPSGVWTRKIADDLWADRLTPFLGDIMVRSSARYDFSKIKKFIGIPGIGQSLAVIEGFLYINCLILLKALEVIPRKLRTPDVKSLFPPDFDIEKTRSPSIAKVASIIFRSSLLATFDSKANPLLCDRSTMRALKQLEGQLEAVRRQPMDTADGALERARAAATCMSDLQALSQWPYFYATALTWLMRLVVVDIGGIQHRDFLQHISEGAVNVTIQIEAELRAIADLIAQDNRLAEAFLSSSAEDTGALLPAHIRGKMDVFLDKYGARSKNRSIYVKRWAEAPAEVFGMLGSILRNKAESSTTSAARHIDEEEHSSGASISGMKAPWIVKAAILLIKPYVRKYLDLREELRFFLDKILFEMRRSLLAVGKKCGLDENVMFLTEKEIEDYITGKMDPDKAESLSKERLESFLDNSTASSFYVDGAPVEHISSEGDNILKGAGTSAGRAKGIARIIRSPSDANLRKDEILVAVNTDPGWTPILSTVGGVISEEGGLLNHLAIVARELGVPAVMGVRGATRKIPEGALVSIDGNSGVVRILAAPSHEPDRSGIE